MTWSDTKFNDTDAYTENVLSIQKNGEDEWKMKRPTKYEVNVILLGLIAMGIAWIAEHIYTWRRWDWEIFGHEWYGLYMVVGSIIVFFLNRRRKDGTNDNMD